MTEPVHDPVRRLAALPQKLMQRHESRPLVSHTQTDSCHPERRVSPHLQGSAAHTNRSQTTAPRRGHGKDPLVGVMRRVTRDQADALPHASCEELSSLATRKTSSGSCAHRLRGLEETGRVRSRRNRKEELSHCLHNLRNKHCSRRR